MTAYVVNHQKKKDILKKRIAGLQHAVKNNFPWAKIVIEAEKVRTAKLAVFKMQFSRNSVLPAHDYEPGKNAFEWQEKSVEEIIDEFGLHET